MPTTSMKRGAELVIVGGITALVNFAFLIDAGRRLGPAEYADFWAAMSLMFFGTLFLNPLAPFASHVAARAIARGRDGQVSALRQRIERLTILAAIPFILLAAIASPFVARALHLRSSIVIVTTAVSIAAYAVLSAERGVFQGSGRFREYNVNAIVEAAVRIVGALLLLPYIPTANAAMSAYLAGLIVAIALLLPRRFQTSQDGAGVALWDEVKGTGVPMFVLMASMAVFQNADSLAIKRWFGIDETAGYSAAASLSRTFTAVATPLWILLVPTVAAARDAAHAARAALRISGAYVALSAVLIAVIAPFAVPLCRGLYGAAFLDAAPLLVPLCGIVVLVNLSLLLAQTLIGVARTRWLYAPFVFALVEIVGLSLYHRSVSEVIALLYTLHATLALLLGAAVVRAARA